MEIGLIGLNHKTAPVELREQLSSTCVQGAVGMGEESAPSVVKEALTLTTCNRVEILLTAEDLDRAFQEVIRTWEDPPRRTEAGLKPYIYVYRGDEAIQHLFRVAASLDSLVVGEPQILGQLKTAYREAVKNRSTGVIMNRLLHKAFTVAKRIRTETGIAEDRKSVV